MHASKFSQTGFTLIEMLLALAIAATLMVSLTGVVGRVLAVQDDSRLRNNTTREARFAMQRMVTAVRQSNLLLLPLADNLNTNWRENVREQSNPPAPPEGDSTLATAVLATTLDPLLDLDEDGFPDADDDRDGRVDEDLPNDKTYDFAPGIFLIDDDGDGLVDEGNSNSDDDEFNSVANEDPIDKFDNDGDNSVDEDPASDMNGDGCPGICGVNDDGDGQTDEGSIDDDDEDGDTNEDWYNPVVFYMENGTLKERTPVNWDVSGGGLVGGQDFITSHIADNVTHFRIERIASANTVLVDITLELTLPGGEPTSLNTRVRVGGGL